MEFEGEMEILSVEVLFPSFIVNWEETVGVVSVDTSVFLEFEFNWNFNIDSWNVFIPLVEGGFTGNTVLFVSEFWFVVITNIVGD